mmetsp:Transcript_17286/g.37714  ORF Transcript_17286/g.37714 Transcript_17286/m.37714 type:complete len:505 (-) Transcript_17286:1745-3259(-)
MTGEVEPPNNNGNLFPKRRKRHFPSGLATRLFNNNNSNGQSPQEPMDAPPPFSRGGVRRDRQGNAVGANPDSSNGNNSNGNSNNPAIFPKTVKQQQQQQQLRATTTTHKKPFRLPVERRGPQASPSQRDISPYTSSSRKSTRTERTVDMDNSLYSSTPSPDRYNRAAAEEGHLAGDHVWAAMNSNNRRASAATTTTTPTASRPVTPQNTQSRHYHTVAENATPITPTNRPQQPLGVDAQDPRTPSAPSFPIFPATSPRTPRQHAGITNCRTPKQQRTPQKTLVDDIPTGASSSSQHEQEKQQQRRQELQFRGSPVGPLQFRGSPVLLPQHSDPVKPQPARPATLAMNRIAAMNHHKNSQQQQQQLQPKSPSVMHALFQPVQQFVQCSAPPEAALLEKSIPMERAPSTVSAASTQVATNRATDMTQRRIREMEQKIQSQMEAQQVMPVQRPAESQDLTQISLPNVEQGSRISQSHQQRKSPPNVVVHMPPKKSSHRLSFGAFPTR